MLIKPFVIRSGSSPFLTPRDDGSKNAKIVNRVTKDKVDAILNLKKLVQKNNKKLNELSSKLSSS